ncbi:MAG: thiol-disulfide isomerase [Lacunisphaera sp.]|nr:thiol-disulfide isomerase [Lacunisphaera sp.]
MTKSTKRARSRPRSTPAADPYSPAAAAARAREAGTALYKLQLYVTGTSPRSTQAISNLRALCEEYLAGRYELEVIDLYQEPERAAAGQVVASPTLVKTLPKPLMRMVGNLANREQLMIKLDLTSGNAASLIRNLR